MSHAQRLAYLGEQERVIAAAQAEQVRVLAVLAADPPAVALPGYVDKDWLHEEVACVLRVAPGTAALRLAEASVALRLPGVVQQLGRGAVSGVQVRTLARAVMGLDQTAATAVAERVLPDAPGQSYGAFARSLQRAMLCVTPAVEESNRDYALSQRRVSFRPELPGTTGMYAVLPDEDAAAITTILRQAAAAAATDADARTVAQRQADTLTDLLLSTANIGTANIGTTNIGTTSIGTTSIGTADRGRPTNGAAPADPTGGGDTAVVLGPCSRQRRPLIQVSVALSTLLGIDNQPGELAGVGPIPAALARRLADDPSGTWRRLITDPRGQLIDYGRSTYRPPAALADHVSARDRTCRFPGCRQPAHTSEIDHRIAWADGGHTNEANLHILCVRHHHLKDQTRWQVHRHPDGHTAWTSPTGNHYAAKPPDPYPTDTTIKATTTSPERPPQRESPRQQQQRRPPGPVTQAEPVSVGARKVATDQQHRDTETDPDPPPF